MSTSSEKVSDLGCDENNASESIESASKENNKVSLSHDSDDNHGDGNDELIKEGSNPTAREDDTEKVSPGLSWQPTLPPSPAISHCDEGPTVGFLHPEMFTGEETIVVSAEPDSSPAILDPSCLNDQRKFSFSADHNNITFHRRFPQVDPLERLINYYSCALQAEILLQGYLYITENYFAFYSNILGLYKTKLLIPVCDVRGITREKTAIIIPNAVGIDTHEGKYVFGSLLSRETTYRLMMEVWKNTISKSLLQMDTFPFEGLRPHDGSTDNGNSSPSTPTKDGLLAEGQLKPDQLRLLSPSQGQSSPSSGKLSKESTIKVASLSRSLTKSEGQGFSKTITHADETPSSITDSDANVRDDDDDDDIGEDADDDALRSTIKPPFKLKPPNIAKVKSKRAAKLSEKWSRFSLLVKSFKERLKGSLRIPVIHFFILLLLIYLLISTASMIHRISNLQEIFSAITSDPKAQKLFNTLEMARIRNGIEHNFEKIEDLKSNLLDLLASIEKISNNCLTMEIEPIYQRQTANTCPLE